MIAPLPSLARLERAAAHDFPSLCAPACPGHLPPYRKRKAQAPPPCPCRCHPRATLRAPAPVVPR